MDDPFLAGAAFRGEHPTVPWRENTRTVVSKPLLTLGANNLSSPEAIFSKAKMARLNRAKIIGTHFECVGKLAGLN